ncbi:MAG: aminotransferase class I/II-fold pyridoxal phosphate-dependent enzyme [Cyclobacteriaceae bacterium]|nr:aminotransferase class I/II-fold pyridoxal phosphate-dependent enzyme [Cyclobacteriaceae bacterium HetDA_MAG_MS6]
MASKLSDVSESIFTKMSRMADEVGAINLSQGFPDFEVSSELIGLVHHAMQQGFNQYAPSNGLPALREAIAETLQRDYKVPLEPDEVVVTSGATEALYATFTALIHSGDEVILFDPCYDSYDPVIRLNGGVPVHLQLKLPDFHIDWDEVESCISNKTKAIVINSPHNPTGSVLDEVDLKQLSNIAERYDLLVISDEVYHKIVFDRFIHHSVLAFEGLRNRSVAIFSFGKTFHATGWKVGYAVASSDISTEIQKVHQFLTFSVNTPLQHGLAAFLKHDHPQLGTFFQRKRDHFLSLMRNSKFEPVKGGGTYFQLLSYKEISDRDEADMADWLTKIHGVAAIPISAFYNGGEENSLLRFCFAKNDDTLAQAAEQLCKV